MRLHGALLLVVVSCTDSIDPPASSASADGGDGTTRDGATGPAGDAATGSDGGSTKDGDAPVVPRIPTAAAGGARITPTEVTHAQYRQFLDDVAGKQIAQPAPCAFKTSFTPPGGTECAIDANGTPKQPVRCADWCDARAFCEWAGLRLCRADEWQAACSGSANASYPYGPSLDQSACHFASPSGPTVDVGSMQSCEGGYPGIFDMLGNVGEWVDACDAVTDTCSIRGGYYSQAPDVSTCRTSEAAPRNLRNPKFGIRCCSR